MNIWLTIETDLLAIEEAGGDIDEDLVNKVFRAAHSIKGASGFFGLTRIKELAHKAETVLDLIRSRKLVPNADITNLLLGAFDKLREMVNDPAGSASADTAAFLTSLANRPARPRGNQPRQRDEHADCHWHPSQGERAERKAGGTHPGRVG